MFRAVLLLAVFPAAGCHVLLPLDGPSPPDTAQIDARADLSRPADAKWPIEAAVPRDSGVPNENLVPGCLSDDFTDPNLAGLTLRKGNWGWVSPSEARQGDLAMRDAHAVLAGFPVSTTKSLSAFTTVTILALDPTMATKGAGAGLGIVLSQATDAQFPFRQVSCLMLHRESGWYWTVSVCDGKGSTCSTLVDSPLSFDHLGQKLQITLLTDGQGKVTCTYKVTTMPTVAPANVASYLTGQPLGMALITFGAEALFHRAGGCP